VIIGERLDTACVRALLAAVAGARDVLVIEGEPGRFCLGMDFAGDHGHASLTGFAGMLRALLLCPVPTLAIIDGPALGGGLGIAAACDVVLASERSCFGLPEALYGLAPAIIRPALLRRLSPAALGMMVATCASRDVHEAHRLGLVDEIGTDPRPILRNLRRARHETIAALRRWDDALLTAQLAAGVDETFAALSRPDVRARIAEAS
jgi:enoyl-CoA hydratase/carnithine racemase